MIWNGRTGRHARTKPPVGVTVRVPPRVSSPRPALAIQEDTRDSCAQVPARSETERKTNAPAREARVREVPDKHTLFLLAKPVEIELALE